jgi:MarR family transcriptional regulator, 2-MHQ and catechol-resistance regulon repressor
MGRIAARTIDAATLASVGLLCQAFPTQSSHSQSSSTAHTLLTAVGEQAEDPRFAAFYGLLVVEWRLGERLDQELESTAGISLNFLELLIHLQWSDGRKRMSELAERLLLSRGGATRLVGRAEEDGLVRREIPPDDRRATYAVLTDAGQEAAERAYPAYLEIVQRLFHDFVDDDEAEVLVRVWNRVLEGNDMSCGPVTHAVEALKSRGVAS